MGDIPDAGWVLIGLFVVTVVALAVSNRSREGRE
jgi:hypothetical protein